MTTSRLTPPHVGEIELSLFGPGYGECVVFGTHGMWVIVDSCLDRGAPVALEYLRAIGVDVEKEVRLVVATHWHDDHIEGMAEVVTACESAIFVCSGALRQEEFLAAIRLKDPAFNTDRLVTRITGGAEEFAQVLQHAETQVNLGKKGFFKWATADKRVLNVEATATTPSCEVWTLSPSDACQLKSVAELQDLFVKAATGPTANRLGSASPNHFAVAVWARIDDTVVLLGSDLEEARGVQGWSTILASQSRPTQPATAFKVAHHGSANADHPPVWSTLLTGARTAGVTPFLNGGVRLPRDSDVARLKNDCSDVYLTASAASRKQARPNSARKLLSTVTKRIEPIDLAFGQVRWRRSAGGTWNAETFGSAVRL